MNIFNRKVLIIGLDGATWDLYEDVFKAGYMPYLNKLKINSLNGKIKSTIPPISPAAWATIQTGIEGINMNIYEFYCFDKLTREIKIVNSSFIKNSIWEILSNCGKRSGVVNVPMTYPPKKISGEIISGILTPSINSNFTYPHELKNYILENLPDYQLYYSEDIRYGNPHYDIKNFIQERVKNLKDRTKLCVWLLNNFKYDIFMVNFQANDILQHVMWGYMEKNHPLYDKSLKHYTFENFHKNLDFCIKVIREEFIRNSGGDLLTIILSDHGCESHKKRFLLGDWLYHQNLLKIKTSFIKNMVRKKFRELVLKFKLSNLQVRFLNILKNFELNIKERRSSDIKVNQLKNIVDWDNSYAFSMGISLYGLIFILKEGNARKKIIDLLKRRLYSIKDPISGEKIVDMVYERDEIYNKDDLNLIPDLIIKPTRGYSFTGLFQNERELFQSINRYNDFAIGKHSEEGMLILNTNSIKNEKQIKANLTDIVPTILKYFGLPIGDQIEGKAINLDN